MIDRLFDKQKISRRDSSFLEISPVKITNKAAKHKTVSDKHDSKVFTENDSSSVTPLINISKTVHSPFFLPAVFAFLLIIIAAFISGYKHYKESKSVILHSENLIFSEMDSLISTVTGIGGSDFHQNAPSFILLQLNPVEHIIRDGDTVYDLAKYYNILPQTLVSYNNITNTRSLYVGQKILIPGVDGMPYTVKNGDSISGIAVSWNISVNDLLDVNNLSSDIISAGQQLFIPGAIDNYQYKRATGTLILWPVSGRLTSKFAYRIDPFTKTRRFHYGLDIANNTGTRINSAIDGKIVEVAKHSGYGNYVVVEDKYGLQTYYAHLSKFSVKKGQYVKQGQKIGEMGSTPESSD